MPRGAGARQRAAIWRAAARRVIIIIIDDYLCRFDADAIFHALMPIVTPFFVIIDDITITPFFISPFSLPLPSFDIFAIFDYTLIIIITPLLCLSLRESGVTLCHYFFFISHFHYVIDASIR